MKSLKSGRKLLIAALFVVMTASLAGCFAYVDHDHHYRRGDYRRDYSYRRDYPYRYRYYERWR